MHESTDPQSDWPRILGIEAQPPAPEPVGAVDLAAQLAGKLCHDFISPASAILSGLDLLDDPTAADMRADAMNLIGASAKKLVALLAFSRVAFGASTTAETFSTDDLRRLTEGVFTHVRAELDWSVPLATLNKPAARALLNLVQIGGAALPTGGTTRLSAVEQDGEVLMSVESVGPRARLRPETLEGLHGARLSEGLGGNWVQAYYLHVLLAAAGGRVDAITGEGRVVLRARCPV
jgi:histidine phosphotransferase ChpT